MTKGIKVYFIGTAGSGKSSLCGAFKTWLKSKGFDCYSVNLDPGAENMSYEADLDIREWITLYDVMEEYGLGPNGAQIVCADLLAVNLPKIKKRLDPVLTNYFLMDTPGQMELFTFRSSSKEIIKAFGDESFIVNIIDSQNATTPYGLTSQLMLSAITQFRFGLPGMNVLGKSDLLAKEDLERIMGWAENTGALYEAALQESQELKNPHYQLGLGFLRVLEDNETFGRLVPVSSKTGEGVEDIYNTLQLTFEGGEDLDQAAPEKEEQDEYDAE